MLWYVYLWRKKSYNVQSLKILQFNFHEIFLVAGKLCFVKLSTKSSLNSRGDSVGIIIRFFPNIFTYKDALTVKVKQALNKKAVNYEGKV